MRGVARVQHVAVHPTIYFRTCEEVDVRAQATSYIETINSPDRRANVYKHPDPVIRGPSANRWIEGPSGRRHVLGDLFDAARKVTIGHCRERERERKRRTGYLPPRRTQPRASRRGPPSMEEVPIMSNAREAQFSEIESTFGFLNKIPRESKSGQDPSHYVRGLIVMQKLEMANEMIEVSVSKATVRSIEAGLFVEWPRAA
ncbi:hypothetical protein V1478_004749 [Vespula squamosa]|uniref:Uncharacterized protein n=1 Tax=Vespula squamosa TaxID=30214 RepID=A0ABD2BH25_VESSQ